MSAYPKDERVISLTTSDEVGLTYHRSVVVLFPPLFLCAIIHVLTDYLYNKRNQPAALSQPNCRSLSLRSVLCVGVLCRYFDDGQVLDSTGDVSSKITVTVPGVC